MPVRPAYRYCQHEVLTRAEWILANNGDSDPTFNRHWVGVHLYSPPAVSTARTAAQQTRGVAGPALGQRLVFAGSVERPHCVLHIDWCEDNKYLAQMIELKDDLIAVDIKNRFHHIKIHSLYCPQEPFNNINYKSH